MALKNAALSDERELLYEDGVPLENETHGTMAWDDLVLPLRAYLKQVGLRAFVGSNSPVAWKRGADALGPDVYVVNGGEHRGQEGWVPWREGGLCPTLIIEILSKSTEKRDRGEKMQIYRDVFKTPDYFLFESATGGLEAYRLKAGAYERVHADRRGRFRCASLPLFLGVVDGRLRWFEKGGHMLPDYDEIADVAAAECARAEREHERAEREHERAEAERARAEAERARAECLSARLREHGIDNPI